MMGLWDMGRAVQNLASSTEMAVHPYSSVLPQTFLFGQWGHGAVWTRFNCAV